MHASPIHLRIWILPLSPTLQSLPLFVLCGFSLELTCLSEDPALMCLRSLTVCILSSRCSAKRFPICDFCFLLLLRLFTFWYLLYNLTPHSRSLN